MRDDNDAISLTSRNRTVEINYLFKKEDGSYTSEFYYPEWLKLDTDQKMYVVDFYVSREGFSRWLNDLPDMKIPKNQVRISSWCWLGLQTS